MNEYLQYLLDDFFYTIFDAIALGLGIAILIRMISWLTPLKLEKVKENNSAVVIIWGIILIVFAVFTISGYFIPE